MYINMAYLLNMKSHTVLMNNNITKISYTEYASTAW